MVSKLLAAVPTNFGETGPSNELANRYQSLGNILGVALNIVFWVGVVISLIFVIMGGIKYATSGGDKVAAQEGKQTVTNAIIGFIVVIGFRALVEIVGRIIGVNNVPSILPNF